MKRISLVLVLTILLTGCAAFSFTPTPTLPPTAETPNPLPEPTDPTQLLTVAPAETFDIVVPSNPSTGYSWSIIPEPDENIVQLVGQNFLAEQPLAIGSGGVDV